MPGENRRGLRLGELGAEGADRPGVDPLECGAALGETPKFCAEAFCARSRILAPGLTGPVLVLLARVFYFGALGGVGHMPAGMLPG